MSRGTYQRINAKNTTYDVLSIDIRKLTKDNFLDDGWLNPYQLEDGEVIFLKISKNWILIKEYDQVVDFDKTNCNFGGWRYWFFCPKCQRRVAKIYLDNKKFICRKCHELVYVSQRRDQLDRIAIKLWKIRKKIGGGSNIFEPIYKKPKGMHWLTFKKIKDKEIELSKQYAKVFLEQHNLKIICN